MRKKWKILLGAALVVAVTIVPAAAQWSGEGDPNSGEDGSSPYGGSDGNTGPNQTPIFYPNWTNYLDNMQREGGYQTVTGNYPGSAPIVSYYPASPQSAAASPGTTAQSGMYSSPQDYYSGGGAQGYPQAYPQAPQQAYPQAPPQQAYYPSAPQQDPQAYAQSYPAQVPQAYQAPAQPAPTQSAKSTKKRRLSAKQMSAAPSEYQQYAQQPQVDPQAQAYAQQMQAYAQQQAAYAQQQQQAAYAQQQQQGYPQQPPYGQQAGYQQQPYGQQPGAPEQPGYGQAQQQPGQEGGGQFSGDPIVQEAQRKAYERAVARQRAAELAAQQQAALQELSQTQQMYASAQQKLREQEERQKALQEEYHKKAVGDAYEGLRAAQRRYYELQGVSGDGGGASPAGYPAQIGQQAPGQQPSAQQPPVQQPMQYPQPVAQAPQYRQQYPQAAPGGPQAMAPSPVQPGQPQPLHPQGQQQEEGGGSGFWSTLKEIFSPPSTGGAPSPRQMFDRKGPRDTTTGM